MPDSKFILKRPVQCDKCPWKITTDPYEIPDGYSEEKHENLSNTIAVPGDVQSVFDRGPLRMMACHETGDSMCIGWLWNQIGEGNNLALRLYMRNCNNFDAVKVIGEQHQCFEDTLPQ